MIILNIAAQDLTLLNAIQADNLIFLEVQASRNFVKNKQWKAMKKAGL